MRPLPRPVTRIAALSAVAALATAGALTAASPASAAEPPSFDDAAAAAFSADAGAATTGTKALAKTSPAIAAIGHGTDGQIVVQTTDKAAFEAGPAVTGLQSYAQAAGTTLDVQEVAHPYRALGEKVSVAPPTETTAKKATTVVGGASYEVLDKSGSGDVCSIGFPAQDSKGNDVLISAGHCGTDAGSKGIYLEKPSAADAAGSKQTDVLDGTDFADFKHVQFGPATSKSGLTKAKAQDFSVLTVKKSAGYSYKGAVTQWTSKAAKADNLASDAKPVTGVHNVTDSDIGKTVYHSGRTTGKTSGKIGSSIDVVDGYSAVLDDDGKAHYIYGFGSSVSVDSGDSGGAVMMGTKAVGVVSGGYPASGSTKGALWTAELSEGLKHLGAKYTIDTKSTSTPTPTTTSTPTPSATATKTSTPSPTSTTTTTTTTAAPTATATAGSPSPTATETSEPAKTGEPSPSTTSAAPEPTDTTTAAPTPTSTKTEVPLTVSDGTVKPGQKIVLDGLQALAGEKIDVVFHSKAVTAADDLTVPASGTVSVTVPSLPKGVHDVSVTSADEKTVYGTAQVEVEKAATPKLSVKPAKVSATDFVKKDDGVELTVTNLKAGADATFTVAKHGKGVRPLTDSATADKSGTATWHVYGTDSSDPSQYVGRYSVKATADGQKTMTGEFTVTGEKAHAGGGSDESPASDTDSSGTLPHTGPGNWLPRAAGGLVLIAAGAATVFITGRRKRG